MVCRPAASLVQLLRRPDKEEDRPLGAGIHPAEDDECGQGAAHADRQEHQRDILLPRLSVSAVFQPRVQEGNGHDAE